MSNFKITKERKLEIQAERLWRLALDTAIYASSGDISFKGIAIVADETRNLANKLYGLLEKGVNNYEMRFALTDVLLQNEFLALNGWIEMLRVHNGWRANPMAVILDEIRRVSEELCMLLGIEKKSYCLTEPEIINPSTVCTEKVYLLAASINGTQIVENVNYVNEVMVYFPNEQNTADKGMFNVRGKKIPLINCYEKYSLPAPKPIDNNGLNCVIIINTGWKSEPERYAVLVDALPVAVSFYSRIPEGGNVPSRSDLFKDEYVRACWDTADGGQMLFLNWEKLNS